MSQCPTCGKQLEPGVRFCPDDGTPLTETAASGSHTPTSSRTQKLTLPLPTTLGNRYRLVEMRGGGGMAKVYRAIDQTLEREVAVKLINAELRAEPEFDARFQREARIASQLADPHIVVVHDFGIDPTYGPYLVMEYLQGQSLRERLQQGSLPLKAGLQLSGQLILALISAHNKGIVHRDIKPDNIFLLNQSGVRLHVRVLDFGIARIYRGDEATHGETLTQPGAVMGTPRYMSPEQLAGNPVDARSDLYSAALVIHEALTGTLPYVSDKKLTELCPDATPVLQDLIDHCLKPNPKDRPSSAVEVYLRLQELGKASGILLLPPGAMDKLVAARQAQEPTVAYVPDKTRKYSPRRRLLIGLGLFLLLALLAWGLIAVINRVKGVASADQESLLGLKVGDSRDDVILKIGKPQREAHGNLRLQGPGSDAMGHVLTPKDLGGDDVRLDALDCLIYGDDNLCVILRNDKVQAIVVRARHKAPTSRGIDVGDSEAQLVHKYTSELQTVGGYHPGPATPGGTPPKPVKIYRYDRLGIGFQVVDEKVTAITLYPKMETPNDS